MENPDSEVNQTDDSSVGEDPLIKTHTTDEAIHLRSTGSLPPKSEVIPRYSDTPYSD